MQNRLFKKSSEPKDATVVIVGNGAISNGWHPLSELVADLTPNSSDKNHPDYYVSRLKDQTSYLSLLSYKHRVARIGMFRTIEKVGGCLKWDWSLPRAVTNFLEYRKKLAEKFESGVKDGKIFLISDLSKTNLFTENDFYITTNWDSFLWDKTLIKNLIHLHGRSAIPESMIMPTEFLTDDLQFNPNAVADKDFYASPNYPNLDVFNKFLEAFRWNVIHELAEVHDETNKWLRNAKRLVIWGVALHTYDSELLAQLATFVNRDSSLKEIILINPDCSVKNKVIAVTGAHAKIVRQQPSLTRKFSFWCLLKKALGIVFSMIPL